MTKSFRVAGLLAFASIIKGNTGVILLTILILTLVSLNLLFVPSLLKGLVSGANERLRNTYSGDIIVTSGTEQELLSNVDKLIGKIEAIDGVTAVTPRNSLGAKITFGSARTNAVIYGIQPDQETKVFKIYKSVIEGSYLSPEDRDKILLGIQVAGAGRPNLELYSRSLQNVHAGDELTVTYANGVQKKYLVKGIFYTEFIQTDLQAFVSQEEFQTVFPLSENRAISIHVKVKTDASIQHIIEQISNIESGLKIFRWEDYAGIVRSLTDSFNVINAIMNTVNLLIAGITIFIVTYIDVVNRRRQIGIQRAIGITPVSITMAYLFRALFYAGAGVILAALLFTYSVTPLEARYPFHFPFGAVYLVSELPDLARMAVIVLGVSLVASFLPVRGVMRMKIMDAIWG